MRDILTIVYDEYKGILARYVAETNAHKRTQMHNSIVEQYRMCRKQGVRPEVLAGLNKEARVYEDNLLCSMIGFVAKETQLELPL